MAGFNSAKELVAGLAGLLFCTRSSALLLLDALYCIEGRSESYRA